MLEVQTGLTIDDRYIRIAYVRSRGPGGQNVNKVNTRAQLRFDLTGCEQIHAAAKKRLAQLAGRRLTKEGVIVIESDRYREQKRNRQVCLQRLHKLVARALARPKKRIATKPTAASKRKRLADKKHRSRIKSHRESISSLDD